MIEQAIEAINPMGTTRGSDGRVLQLYCRLCGSGAPHFYITMNSDTQFAAGCRSCGYSVDIYNTGLAKRKYEKQAAHTAE